MTRFSARGLLSAFLIISVSLMALAAQAQDNRNLAIKSQAGVAPVERRVALVIGNSAYQKSPLKNPVNDAVDVSAKLRALGFEVIERTNLKSSQIGRTLREFRARLAPGSVALFFYAGHGLQIKGENYLPAVDADIEGEEDVPNQSIAVRQVMDVMEDAKTRLNLAFLDACRNNPYNRGFRSAGDGLARISAPAGTLISFATRPGSVAADGAGRNGLYTTHLLTAIEAPNLPVELMLKRVTSGVKGASRGMQEPWMEGSIDGDFYFRLTPGQGSPGGVSDSGSQQDLVNQAVQDAVRRASEQAARERAELQAAMQKTLEQALARQNALLEAQGGKRQEPAVQAGAAAASTIVASLGPATTAASLRPMAFNTGRAPQPGDEWEYLARDNLFGKNRTMLWRVRAIDPSTGVLEELLVNGKTVTEWVFNGQPQVLGVPTESSLVFGPHWTGGDIPLLAVHGAGDCAVRLRCEVMAREVRRERISVPAGTFDAVRLDGRLSTSALALRFSGSISIWYSEKDRRLLKQAVSIQAQAAGLMVDETIELQAARTNSP